RLSRGAPPPSRRQGLSTLCAAVRAPEEKPSPWRVGGRLGDGIQVSCWGTVWRPAPTDRLQTKKPFQKSGGLVEELKLFAGLPAQAKAPGADDTGRQLLESEEVGPLPLIALHQPAEVPKPAMRPLDHKTCVPQAAAVFAAPHGQQRADTPRQHQGDRPWKA